MAEKRSKKHQIEKKIIIILSCIFVAVLVVSFLYNLMQLIIEPSNIFIIENRKYL